VKILLTGITGQVGHELERSLQGLGEVIGLDRAQMDLSDLGQVRDVIRSIKPGLIVNPAAYTAVDKAESEPELAMRINGEAPRVMAEEARSLGAGLIHYSTDYVFDGAKRDAQGEMLPYSESDMPNPTNVYGESKLAGEQAIVASGCDYLILRTSWVYSMYGKNFLSTMLRLGNERDELKVVDDQWGAPTWAGWIADTTAQLIAQATAVDAGAVCRLAPIAGIVNMVNSGHTTWCRFAQRIFIEAAATGRLLHKDGPNVLPITTDEYSTAATRPSNSMLSTAKLEQLLARPISSWSQALVACLNRTS
jgi:dTDP-4-dehydrorhamnose reductase